MVTQVKVINGNLTFVSRSIKGEHVHVNLVAVKGSQSARVKHHRQLQRANLELANARKIDAHLLQANDRKVKRANKRLALEIGQIMARQ